MGADAQRIQCEENQAACGAITLGLSVIVRRGSCQLGPVPVSGFPAVNPSVRKSLSLAPDTVGSGSVRCATRPDRVGMGSVSNPPNCCCHVGTGCCVTPRSCKIQNACQILGLIFRSGGHFAAALNDTVCLSHHHFAPAKTRAAGKTVPDHVKVRFACAKTKIKFHQVRK